MESQSPGSFGWDDCHQETHRLGVSLSVVTNPSSYTHSLSSNHPSQILFRFPLKEEPALFTHTTLCSWLLPSFPHGLSHRLTTEHDPYNLGYWSDVQSTESHPDLLLTGDPPNILVQFTFEDRNINTLQSFWPHQTSVLYLSKQTIFSQTH